MDAYYMWHRISIKYIHALRKCFFFPNAASSSPCGAYTNKVHMNINKLGLVVMSEQFDAMHIFTYSGSAYTNT